MHVQASSFISQLLTDDEHARSVKALCAESVEVKLSKDCCACAPRQETIPFSSTTELPVPK